MRTRFYVTLIVSLLFACQQVPQDFSVTLLARCTSPAPVVDDTTAFGWNGFCPWGEEVTDSLGNVVDTLWHEGIPVGAGRLQWGQAGAWWLP